MDKFIHDENLKLLHKRLTETTDEKQRQVLHNLIAEHDAKYREWQSETRLTCSLGAGGLQALPASKSSFAHNQGGPLCLYSKPNVAEHWQPNVVNWF